jgi:hypothetical protein
MISDLDTRVACMNIHAILLSVVIGAKFGIKMPCNSFTVIVSYKHGNDVQQPIYYS